jgi:hypothetical protein
MNLFSFDSNALPLPIIKRFLCGNDLDEFILQCQVFIWEICMCILDLCSAPFPGVVWELWWQWFVYFRIEAWLHSSVITESVMHTLSRWGTPVVNWLSGVLRRWELIQKLLLNLVINRFVFWIHNMWFISIIRFSKQSLCFFQ